MTTSNLFILSRFASPHGGLSRGAWGSSQTFVQTSLGITILTIIHLGVLSEAKWTDVPAASDAVWTNCGCPMVSGLHKEGPKFMQRLVAKQKARVKDSSLGRESFR